MLPRDDESRAILRAIWGGDPSAEITAADLRDAIRAHGKAITGRHIGERVGKDIASEWLNVRRWITDNGRITKGRAYRLADVALVQPDADQASKAKERAPLQIDFGAASGASDVPF